jgi:hypothetical protein
MTTPQESRFPPLAIGCALILAAGIWLGLTAIATLPDQSARIARATATLQRGLRLSQLERSAPPYPANAFCRHGVDQAARDLEARLAAAAAGAGLELGQTSPSTPRLLGGGTLRVEEALSVKGRYEGVITFMTLLAGSTPAIFTDKLTLHRDRDGDVTLAFNAAVLCR